MVIFYPFFYKVPSKRNTKRYSMWNILVSVLEGLQLKTLDWKLKLLTKQNSNKRLQPYSLSKPKPNVSRDDNNATSLSISKSSSDSSTSSDKSQSQTNNPILSRLSNISNSLKSIFVRPKHIKPVDLGKIIN